MVIKFQSEYEYEGENKSVWDSKKQLRKIQPEFSSGDDFMKDVQSVIDENHLNFILMNMFHNAETYSLTEWLIGVWPEQFYGGAAAIKGIMSVGVWSHFFP